MIHAETRVVDIDQLKPWPKNARRGDIDLIAESLQVNGQYKPVVVRAGTNEVLAGNHTLAAARKLGWRELAANFVEVDDRVVELDPRYCDVICARWQRHTGDLPSRGDEPLNFLQGGNDG